MAEEATTETPEKAPSEVETGAKAEDILDNAEDHNDGLQFESLFDDEEVSDAELKGEETTTDDEKAAASESKGEDESKKAEAEKEGEAGKETKADEEKAKAEAKAKEEAEAKAKDESKAEPEALTEAKQEAAAKTEALRQERQKSQTFKSKYQTLEAENQRLTAELEKSKNKVSGDADEKFKDFKVKTTEEFRQLLDEDPDEAAVYQHDLVRFQQYQSNLQRQQMAEKQAKDTEQSLIREGAEAIEKIVPGFHKEGDQEVKDLAQFAVDTCGLSPNVLYDLTNPKTRIVAGDGEKYILGAGAAQVVGMIKSHHSKSSQAINESELREKLTAEIEAELRPKIEAEAQKTILEKMQSGTGEFKSLDQVTQSGSKEVKTITGAVTEAQLANMSEAEERALLGG